MDSCDILIIGGGPAGSSCARALRRAGLDIVIMDKKSFPRTKVCAGWVTPAVIDTLEINIEEYAKGRTLQPIKGFRLSVLGGKEVEFCYEQVASFGILRLEFDDYLLRRCEARMKLGESFKTIARSGMGWLVNDSIEARLVIGAGGHFCPVARFMGAKERGPELVVAAQEVEFELTQDQIARCKVRPEIPELYFCEDLKGYAWAFRKGNFLNIDLGREDNNSLSEHTQKFLNFLKSSGRVPQESPDQFHGHAYILYGHTQRELLADGLMLIGDAAGLAYPQSGEGIRTAVESGMLAAQTILTAEGDFSKTRLAPYSQRLRARFGRVKSANYPSGLNASLARVLMGTRWFSRHIVMDRWFLHRHQASLSASS